MTRNIAIMLCAAALIPATWGAPARAQAPSPEMLVAQAATAYGSINFGPREEEQAIADLTAALAADPTNSQARRLLDVIQQRRQQRQEQQQQQGQEQLNQERQEGQDQQQQQEQPPPEQNDQQQQQQQPDQQRPGDNENVNEQPDQQDTPVGNERPQEEGMTREEAERLLDALERQEQQPEQRQGRRRRAEGPRW